MGIRIDARLEASNPGLAHAMRSKGTSIAGRFDGDAFRGWVADNAAIGAQAITAGIGAATLGLKTDLRKAIAAGGLGGRLPMAIQSALYPRGGKVSLNAAGLVYIKGKRVRDYLDAYAEGATITANNRKYLAIPTENAAPFLGGGGRAARISAGGWGYKIGIPTKVIPTRNPKAPFLIVADLRRGRGKRGGFRKPSAAALKTGDVETVVLFILVPLVHVQKRISVEGLAQQWTDRIPGLIEAAMPDQ